jgi:hypothetical protein
MLRRLIMLVTAAATGFAVLSVPALAEVAFPPGLRIGLEPAAGLVASRRFPGFEDDKNKVAIAILDLPARAYEDIERSAFGPQQTGLADLKRESFPFGSGIGFLISGKTEENGVKLTKWFLLGTAVAGEVKDLAMLINVQVPDAARDVYTDAVVRKMLASVTFRTAPIAEQLGLLPFKVGDLAGFRVMQVLPQGGVILIDGPVDDMAKNTYVIVSVGQGAPETPDERGKFSRDLLSNAPLRNLSVTSAEAMRIGGGQGYEIRGQAQGLQGEPINLVQWVRFGSGGFLRVIGVGPKQSWDDVFTRLRAVRDGVEPR